MNTTNKSVDVVETNHDDFFTGDIFVGNPPQRMRALFDTGSADIFLLGVSNKKAGNDTH